MSNRKHVTRFEIFSSSGIDDHVFFMTRIGEGVFVLDLEHTFGTDENTLWRKDAFGEYYSSDFSSLVWTERERFEVLGHNVPLETILAEVMAEGSAFVE